MKNRKNLKGRGCLLDDYQAYAFDKNRIDALLDHIEYRGLVVASSPLPQALPDIDDELSLEVAIAAKVVCIITGNHIHFPPDLCLGVKVFSPSDFLAFYKKQHMTKR